jgi:hypothetical protein
MRRGFFPGWKQTISANARHPGSHATRSRAWLSGIHSVTLISNGMDPGYAVRLRRPTFRDDEFEYSFPLITNVSEYQNQKKLPVIPGLVSERSERRVSGIHAATLMKPKAVQTASAKPEAAA